MRKALSTSASLTLLTAGVLGGLAGTAVAGQESDGSGGVGSGNQVSVPVEVEAELCGNALAALGISQAQCTKAADALYTASGRGGGQHSNGSGGVASGNQINIPVDVAIGVCGNSAAVGGVAKATCTEVVEGLAGSEDNGAQTSDGSGGVASGNQINIPVDVAIDVCGNSLAALGIAEAECTTVVTEIGESPENQAGDGQQSDGSGGVASGNQVSVPVDAAVTICGNAVAVLGVAEAECMTTISSEEEYTDGGDGGGGNGGATDPDGENPEGGSGDEEDEDSDDGGNGSGDGAGNGTGGGGDADERGKPAADSASDSDSASALPVTGAALGGLVAAAITALAGGGTTLYFARRRAGAEELTEATATDET